MEMSCPICFEDYSPENPARGPEERMPAACQHSICQQCCMRIAATERHPFICPICRRNNSCWFLCEFCSKDEDKAEYDVVEFRNAIAASLQRLFPQLYRNWERDLPYNIEALEMLEDDPSLAFGMR